MIDAFVDPTLVTCSNAHVLRPFALVARAELILPPIAIIIAMSAQHTHGSFGWFSKGFMPRLRGQSFLLIL